MQLSDLSKIVEYLDFQADMANDDARDCTATGGTRDEEIRLMNISNTAWNAKYALQDYIDAVRGGKI